MNIKVDFDNIVVKEDKNDFNVKVLMLKGEKGDPGDGEANVIEKVQVNGTNLPITNKTVNVPVPVVDSSISSSSTNPVQNNAIYNALSDKVDTSALDNYYETSEVDALLNKKIYHFNNILEMKAYNLSVGDYVITKGYYSANDGGGSCYEIITSNLVDDGGLIHVLTNGLRAKLIVENNTVNAKQFGAKSDKTGDISSIISLCDTKEINLYLSEGEYLLSNSVEISNIDIICEDNAYIYPDFTDDLIKIKSRFHKYKLNIDGSEQNTTDNTKFAITIGVDGYNARYCDLSFSKIQNMKQSGICWEHGAFANFTNLYMYTISGYGINCTGNYNDNNHGIFTNTELIYCGVIGCLIAKGNTEDLSSRHHIFNNFKIFGCNKGMEIQTHSNMGSVMFEKCSPDHTTNANCCELTADSKGNKIEIINDMNVWENIVDNGNGNLICGYSRYGFYSFKDIRANSIKVHKEGLTGRLEFTQENTNEIIDRITDTTSATIVKHIKGTASKRTDEYEGNVKIGDFKFSTAKTGVIDLDGVAPANGYKSVVVASASSWASTNPVPTIFTTLYFPNGFDTSKNIQLITLMNGSAIVFKIYNNTNADIDLTGAKIRWTCINHY